MVEITNAQTAMLPFKQHQQKFVNSKDLNCHIIIYLFIFQAIH